MNRTCNARIGRTLGLLAMGAVLLASSGLTCAGFGADMLTSMFDMCFLFDCNNGAIGGLIDFCSEVSIFDDSEGTRANDIGPFFADCPQEN